MPDKFTRFGEFFMQGLAKTLAEGTVVHVPHVGACAVSHVSEPRLLQSSWSMNVDISFPESYSNMTIGMFTFGSCLMKDTESITLPASTDSSEEDDARYKEHMDAWYRLLESLEGELDSMGYTVGSSEGCDIHLITDYMPSDGIYALALKPSVLKPELIRLCQQLVRQEAKWNFWIRLAFDFREDKHKGFDENILVRPDRVVHDYDAARLAKEFPGEIPVLEQEAGS
ncbi:hypothetical protein ACVC7V_24690 [Hydrogenophaga sp. A37]|uniref:hypothetical protein n=1 Tax=Hydrogenophaga sp. A37 TaxID=1945864 RepID=UPI0009857258|nr:hypothetical protein [Hydrogenophaga sp. A37]OOG88632.1 hypothetical protein B0E41_01995 [Hydrogenophaga sp. A37]